MLLVESAGSLKNGLFQKMRFFQKKTSFFLTFLKMTLAVGKTRDLTFLTVFFAKFFGKMGEKIGTQCA